MILSIILKLVLFLLISCNVAENSDKLQKLHKLHYQFGDWQPHFGYTPGHMASEHNSRPKPHRKVNQAMTRNFAEEEDSMPLDSYVVRLLRNDRHICSGIVIGVREVLTNRLCLSNVPPAELQVKLFDNTTHSVAGFRETDEYATGLGSEFLEVVQLTENLEKRFNREAPMCMGHVTFSDMVDLWSWKSHAWELRKKPARQIPEQECKQMINYTESESIGDHVNCLQNNQRSSRCKMNYGLPYAWKGQFCGMNLMGHNCAGRSTADVYVKLMNVKAFTARKEFEIINAKVDSAMP